MKENVNLDLVKQPTVKQEKVHEVLETLINDFPEIYLKCREDGTIIKYEGYFNTWKRES